MDLKNVVNGENRDLLVQHESLTEEFEAKQNLLEFFIHAADVSTQTRSFEVALQWTKLLYEEFFNQGDVEKEQGLPVSFLCDRETTMIPQGQPGFISFILTPLFTTLSNIAPECKQFEINALENSDKWKNFVATEDFSKVYKKKSDRRQVS